MDAGSLGGGDVVVLGVALLLYDGVVSLREGDHVQNISGNRTYLIRQVPVTLGVQARRGIGECRLPPQILPEVSSLSLKAFLELEVVFF